MIKKGDRLIITQRYQDWYRENGSIYFQQSELIVGDEVVVTNPKRIALARSGQEIACVALRSDERNVTMSIRKDKLHLLDKVSDA